MRQEDRDVYAPPMSEVEVSPSVDDGRVDDRVLRWVGAMCLVVTAVISRVAKMERLRSEDVLGVLLGLGMVWFLLGGGRRWLAVITVLALLGVVSVVVSWGELVAYAEERSAVNGSLLWGCHLLANVVTTGCGVALLVRGRKRK